MNGLEELIEMRDKGCKWLAINNESWAARVFREMPYWNGDAYKGIWSSRNSMWRITPQNGEILALQKHQTFKQPFSIDEAIEVLKRYHKENDKQTDMVNHPAHYTSGNIEVWDFIIDQDLNYCRGSAVKYISRAGKSVF